VEIIKSGYLEDIIGKATANKAAGKKTSRMLLEASLKRGIRLFLREI